MGCALVFFEEAGVWGWKRPCADVAGFGKQSFRNVEMSGLRGFSRESIYVMLDAMVSWDGVKWAAGAKLNLYTVANVLVAVCASN